MSKNKKIFDAELYEACRVLKLMQEVEKAESVTVLLDSQAVIKRLQHIMLRPEQELAIHTQRAVQQLKEKKREPTVQ